MQFKYDKDVYDVGTCASSNWNILDDAKDEDIWVHLADFPSSYVICKWDNNMTFPTNAKKKKYIHKRVKVAGRICFQKSENKIPDNLNKINVIYIDCKYVKTGEKVGQAELIKEPNVLTIDRN